MGRVFKHNKHDQFQRRNINSCTHSEIVALATARHTAASLPCMSLQVLYMVPMYRHLEVSFVVYTRCLTEQTQNDITLVAPRAPLTILSVVY
jgi:hypothetical protein